MTEDFPGIYTGRTYEELQISCESLSARLIEIENAKAKLEQDFNDLQTEKNEQIANLQKELSKVYSELWVVRMERNDTKLFAEEAQRYSEAYAMDLLKKLEVWPAVVESLTIALVTYAKTSPLPKFTEAEDDKKDTNRD